MGIQTEGIFQGFGDKIAYNFDIDLTSWYKETSHVFGVTKNWLVFGF